MRLCFFPEIETITIKFEVNARQVRVWLDESEGPPVHDVFDWMHAVSETCAQTFKQAKVDTGLFVRTTLFKLRTQSLYNDWRDTDAFSEVNIDNIMCDLGRHEDNHASFRAHPSEPDDPYTFHGLRLDFESCGQVDRATTWLKDTIKEDVEVSARPIQLQSLLRRGIRAPSVYKC